MKVFIDNVYVSVSEEIKNFVIGPEWASTLIKLPLISISKNTLIIETGHHNWPQLFIYQSKTEINIFTDSSAICCFLKKQSLKVDKSAAIAISFLGSTSNGRWIFSNSYVVPPNSKFKITDNNKPELFQKNHTTYLRKESPQSKHEFVSHYIKCMEEKISILKKINKPIYVGVSGGFDSRICLAFCNKYNLKIIPFYIGLSHACGFETRDYKSAKQLCKKFNLKLEIVPYVKDNMKTRIEHELDNNILGGSEAFRLCEFPEWSKGVLINGAWGFLVHSPNIDVAYNDEILYKKSLFYNWLPFRKLRVVLNALIGTNFPRKGLAKNLSDIEKILRQEVSLVLGQYSELSADEVVVNYTARMQAAMTSSGVFESLENRQLPFSIYAEQIPNTSSSYYTGALVNRSYAREILNDIGDFDDVFEQGSKGMLDISIAKKIRFLGSYLIRGQGVMNYKKSYAKYKAEIKSLLKENNALLSHEELKIILKMSNKGVLDPSVALNILKFSLIANRFN
ncbi:MAG: hypothetical protein ACPG3V_02100 [Porticoccaceae bacterium]